MKNFWVRLWKEEECQDFDGVRASPSAAYAGGGGDSFDFGHCDKRRIQPGCRQPFDCERRLDVSGPMPPVWRVGTM